MEFTSTVTAKGQTTVPREVRKKLGLGPRQKIVYVFEEDGVHIRAAAPSLMEVAGSLASDQPALSKEEERRIYRSRKGSSKPEQ